jgi:hypothetical protein
MLSSCHPDEPPSEVVYGGVADARFHIQQLKLKVAQLLIPPSPSTILSGCRGFTYLILREHLSGKRRAFLLDRLKSILKTFFSAIPKCVL